MTDDVAAPPGVEITAWDDFPKKRQQILTGAKTALQESFPQSYGGVRLELHDLDYDNPKEFTLSEQKDALMKNQFLHHKLKGTLKLFDEKTGALLDQKTQTLMRVPYLTERGTFLHNGNEITTNSQARLMPGIYTRRKNSGEIESQVNAKRGSGSSFRVRLEPESGLFKVDIGQSSLRLYSLLKDIGVSDQQIEKTWGPELLKKNQDSYDARVFEKAYDRLVRRPDPKATREQKVEAIKQALDNTQVDRSVVMRTLPNLFATKFSSMLAFDPTMPRPQSEKKEFNHDDCLMLAELLNQKFHAGIPLDAPTSEIVAMVMGEIQKLMPSVNEQMLAQTVGQQQKEARSKQGYLMLNFEPEDAMRFSKWSRQNIPDSKLGASGREDTPHITLRWGINTGDIGHLKSFFSEQSPVQATLGALTRFPGVDDGNQDALVAPVESESIHKLHHAVVSTFHSHLGPVKFNTYRPHVTLAYLRRGEMPELEGNKEFHGQTFQLKKVVYSNPRTSSYIDIPLGTN
jgi:2'-5' RNA ligase